MLAKHGIWNEPITGLVLAALVAAAVGLGSGLVLLRTGGLTLLMLTLCTMALLEEAANLAHEYTGGFDGLDSLPIAPLFGVFEFNPLYPKTQYLYVLSVLFLCFVFVRTLVYSPFGQSLTGIRENTLRMHAVGAPVRGAARPLLRALGGDRRHRRRHLGSGERLRESGHARPRPRGDGAHHPRPRRLRPPLRRVRRRHRLHGAVALPVEDLSDRLAARARVLARRHRACSPATAFSGSPRPCGAPAPAAARDVDDAHRSSRRARCAATSALWPPRATSISGSRPARATP